MKTNRAEREENYRNHERAKSTAVQGASAKGWNGDV